LVANTGAGAGWNAKASGAVGSLPYTGVQFADNVNVYVCYLLF
jgi:hypothetical protein